MQRRGTIVAREERKERAAWANSGRGTHEIKIARPVQNSGSLEDVGEGCDVYLE